MTEIETYQLILDYSHDYRNIPINQNELKSIFEAFVLELKKIESKKITVEIEDIRHIKNMLKEREAHNQIMDYINEYIYNG